MIDRNTDQSNLATYRRELARLVGQIEALEQIVNGLEKRLSADQSTTEIADQPKSLPVAEPAIYAQPESISKRVERYLTEASSNGLSYDEIEMRLGEEGVKIPEKLRQTLHDTMSNLRKKGVRIDNLGSKGSSRYRLVPPRPVVPRPVMPVDSFDRQSAL